MSEEAVSAASCTATDEGAGDTRERLLDAAEELFARSGYAGASVRDITAAAGSNLAAVNYHFGGKHNLYRETLLRRLAAIRRQRLAALERAPGADGAQSDLAATLRSFAEAFLAPVREAPPDRRPLRLLMREVVDPQLPPGLFEAELGEPVQQALTTAIANSAPSLDPRTVQLCAQSFLAQLVHILHAHRFSPGGEDRGDARTLTEIVEHIVLFTLAAIHRLQEARP